MLHLLTAAAKVATIDAAVSLYRSKFYRLCSRRGTE